MFKLRSYQEKLANEISSNLIKYRMSYFVGQVRIGKTITALKSCENYGAKRVLFVTKKKAISSIQEDYDNFKFDFHLDIINYESIHKIENNNYNVIIYDESHTCGSFPKPAKRVKIIKKRFSRIPCIFLSGTPAVESGSQWYHQFYVSDYSPFNQYTNFYKWTKDYVEVKERNFGYAKVKDYSCANRELIHNKINHLLTIFTQKNAGFETIVNEKILYCDIKPTTTKLAKSLIRDKVIQGNTDVILADTPVKLQSKVHQIYNGTCIGESGNVLFLDNSKVKFIKEEFKDNQIAIFYYYKGELELLKEEFGNNLTTDLDEFNSTTKNIAIQQTGTEGLNLSKAKYLVYYNFGFSGKNYIQSIARLLTHDRKTSDVYFIFEKNGISEKIYNSVKNKENYNIRLFKKDYKC